MLNIRKYWHVVNLFNSYIRDAFSDLPNLYLQWMFTCFLFKCLFDQVLFKLISHSVYFYVVLLHYRLKWGLMLIKTLKPAAMLCTCLKSEGTCWSAVVVLLITCFIQFVGVSRFWYRLDRLLSYLKCSSLVSVGPFIACCSVWLKDPCGRNTLLILISKILIHCVLDWNFSHLHSYQIFFPFYILLFTKVKNVLFSFILNIVRW